MAAKNEKRTVTIIMDGDQPAKTIKDLAADIKILDSYLRSIDRDTDAFKKGAAKARELKAEIREANQQLRATADATGRFNREMKNMDVSQWSKFTASFRDIAIGSMLGEMFTDAVYGIGNFFRQAVSGSNEYSDVLADVMKTTDLTAQQVTELSRQLGKLDTRTGRTELLELAKVAGKLGITAQQDIMGFVKAMDILTVAMGEDLGGAEEVARHLGKIVEVFNLTTDYEMEDALIRVGSAINQLGKESTANEGYIVDFTRRLAGIAPLANISVQDIMGMGAALDAMGQTAEVSSTAISKLLVRMAEKKEAFARIANIELKQFTEMMDKDAGQALLMVLERVGQTTNGISQLTEVLGDMGTDGGRIVGVLGSMANNIEFVRQQQAIANDEFERGTSALEEFTIKNENQAGRWEKAMKRINAAWMPIRQQIGETAGVALKFFADNIGAIFNLVKMLVIGAGAWATYKTAVLAAQAAQWLFGVSLINTGKLMVAQRAGLVAYAGAKALLTLNLTRATAAMRLFNTITRLNPIGLLVTVVTGAVLLFQRLANNVDDVTKAMNDVHEQTVKERVEIERLNRAATSEVLTREQRLAAVQKLRDAMPGFLDHLTDEQIITGQAKTAIDQYIVALKNKMMAQAMAGVAQTKANELAKAELDLIRLETEGMTLWENIWNGNINYFIREKKAEIDGLKKEIEQVLNQQTMYENAKPLPGLKRQGVVGTLTMDFGKPEFESSTRPIGNDEFGAGGGDEGDGGKAQAEAEARKQAYERALKDYAEFLADWKEMQAKDAAERQGREQQEIYDAARKYEKLLEKLKSYRDKGVITEEEYAIQRQEIVDQMETELLAIKQRYQETADELEAERHEAEMLLMAERHAEKIKAIEEYHRHVEELERQHDAEVQQMWERTVDAYLGAMQNLVQVAGNFSDRRIAKNEEEYEKNLQHLTQWHEQGIINTEEFERKKIELETNYIEENKKIRLRQFRIEKAANLADATISGALAVMRALQSPPYPPLNTPFVIATGILAATQIAKIASQQPPRFAKGGLLSGPLHSEGGMPIINPRTGRKVAEIEGGEAVLSRRTVSNNWPLVSALLNSSMNLNGASVMRSVTAPPRFEFGGVMPFIPQSGSSNSTGAPVVSDNRELIEVMYALKQELSALRQSQPLKAVVVYNDAELWRLRKELADFYNVLDRSGKR